MSGELNQIAIRPEQAIGIFGDPDQYRWLGERADRTGPRAELSLGTIDNQEIRTTHSPLAETLHDAFGEQ